ncbi:hypothetical protein H340_10385 [Streptomyces mobaraensis NBRC 13819 = DSM 40847]|uniref:Nitroreductase domain-containing protein n=2 Tax=Streptomyces mobaraensis TaxID=35621 RepID=M3A6A2_STRM1|nr:hypothetical protein H340_10385 [Streptomyces mobaraensis NBRC 13819 = DSM 40847]
MEAPEDDGPGPAGPGEDSIAMYVPELDAAALETLVAAAVAAPSLHAARPWRLRLEPDSRALEVRSARGLPPSPADPAARSLHLSAGAAVFNLRVAAAHLGWEAVVRPLPAPDDPGLLAVVTLRAAGAGRSRDRDLYAAVARCPVSRLPFTARPVPASVVAELCAGARAEGTRLYVPDPAATRRVLGLTAEGEQRSFGGWGHRADTGRSREHRAWVTPPGACPYGTPPIAPEPLDLTRKAPVGDFLGSGRTARIRALPLEPHVRVALLLTDGDGPEDWLRAGQAVERVLLVAAARGVRTAVLQQALDWPDLRRELPGGGFGRPQCLIRFGYGPDDEPVPRATAGAVTRM